MSTMSNAPALAQSGTGESRRRGAAATLARWWAAYTTWRTEQAAMTLLRSMSERELKDMGQTRSSISGAVKGELGHERGISRYY